MNSPTNRGFTLIEALIAVAVLAILALGILSMTSYSMKVNSISKSHTMAVQLAEEALEKKLRENFDSLTSDSPESFGQIVNFPTFRRRIDVASIDSDNYNITVTVAWMSQGKESPPVTFTAMRTRQ